MRIKDRKKLIAVVLTLVVIVGAVVAVKWKDISSDADRSEISKQEETTSFDNPEDYDESDEGEVADYPGVTADDEEIDVVSRFKAMSWDEIKKIVKQYLNEDLMILDYDTGGGEFLLSLHHPYEKTAATEGFPPNVQLCKEILLPLGIDFKVCDDPANIPFADESFDIIINRHGDFHAKEVHRLLKKGGIFITQQVGSENDRELVELVLPGTPKPFPHLNLREQRNVFEEAGFEILQAEEAYLPIKFYDVGAFVWFARIIEWEFPGFSVEKCFEQLLEIQ